MKISSIEDKNAILPEYRYREKRLVIDGGQSKTLLLSHSEKPCLELQDVTNLTVTNLSLHHTIKKTRISRFFDLIPILWKLCK